MSDEPRVRPTGDLRVRQTTLCVGRSSEWDLEQIQAALKPALATVLFVPSPLKSHWRTMTVDDPEVPAHPTWCDTNPQPQPHDHIVVYVMGTQMALDRVPEDVAS